VPKASHLDPRGFTDLQNFRRGKFGTPKQHHPQNRRYTFQYLVHNADTFRFKNFDVRENTDAAFLSYESERLPSPAICHYIYAAAVVRAYARYASWPAWGRIFSDSVRPPPNKKRKTCFESNDPDSKPSIGSRGRGLSRGGGSDQDSVGSDVIVEDGDVSQSDFEVVTSPLQDLPPTGYIEDGDDAVVTQRVFGIMDFIALSRKEQSPVPDESKSEFLHE